MNLSTLPSDIIRQIVHVGLEYVDELRLITPRWNSVVSEELQERTRLPAIKSFSWNLFDRSCENDFHDCRVIIGYRYATYFGISKWCCYRTSSATLGEYSNLFCASTIPTRLLARCSHIERFELDEIRFIEAFYAMQAALCVVTVNELVVSKTISHFSSENAHKLHAFIRTHLVQKLCLRFTHEVYVFKAELAEFLSNVAHESVKVSVEFSCCDEQKMSAVNRNNFWKEAARELAGERSIVTNITLTDDVVLIEFESRTGNEGISHRPTVTNRVIQKASKKYKAFELVMFSEAVDTMNLTTLPSDIIRLIIRAGLEYVDDFRLISPRWNAVVSNVLRARSRLPVINYLRWTMDVRGHYVQVTINQRFAKYFGISKWCCDWTPQANMFEFSNWILNTTDSASLRRIFDRCSHRKKKKFELEQIRFVDTLYSMQEAPCDLIVKELVVSDNVCYFGSENKKAQLLAFIQRHAVQKLYLHFATYSEYVKGELAKFLSGVANQALKISVAFRINDGYSSDSLHLWKKRGNYLCGNGMTVTNVILKQSYVQIEIESRSCDDKEII